MPNRNQSRAGRPSIGKCFTIFLSLCINNSARGLKEARSDAGEVTCSRPELVPPHGVVHAPFAVGNRVGEGGRGGVLISEMFEGCSAVFHAASVVLRRRYEGGDETMSRGKESAREDCRKTAVGESRVAMELCFNRSPCTAITKP